MPDDLAHQWELAPRLYEALGWSCARLRQLEADDLLGVARPGRGGRRRRGADPHGRPRHVPVRDRRGVGASAGRAGQARPRADGAGGGRGALRDRARARPGLHRAARRPLRRPAGDEGDRREARRGHPAPPRVARGGPRCRRKGRPGAKHPGPRARRARGLPRDRDAARRPLERPPDAPTDRVAGRGGGGGASA